MIWARTDTSSAETGSSSTMSRVSVASARAIAMRCRCPPLNSWGNSGATSGARPTSSSTRPTRSSIAACGRSVWISSGSAMMSPTRMRGLSELNGSWNTTCTARRYAMRSAPLRLAMSRPSNLIVPEVGVSWRRISLEVVVFPQPDSPMSPSVSPAPMARSMPSTAFTSLAGPPSSVRRTGKCFVRARTSRTGEDIAEEPAAGDAPVARPKVARLLGHAARHDVGAARMERAARRKIGQVRGLAADGIERLLAAELRHRAEQRARVGMLGGVEELAHRRLLDDLARVHDGDPVAHLRDDAKVVRHEDQGHAGVALDVLQEVEVLRLDRDVEVGRRLVGDHEPRPAGQRDGADDALAHAAAHLMRILAHAPLRRRDPDGAQQALHALAQRAAPQALVEERGLRHLAEDREERVQRRHRVLQDDGDPAAADPPELTLALAREILALEDDRAAHDAGGAWQEPDDREAGGRLPAPRLADEPEGLAFTQRDVDRVHREDDQEDARARKHREPPLARHQGRARLREHEAPRRLRRRYADAEKAERGLGDDDDADGEARQYRRRVQDVRQDVLLDHAQLAGAGDLGQLDEVALAQAQHLAADDTRIARPVHRAQDDDDVPHARADHGREEDREDDRRQGEPGVGHAHDDLVHPAAQVAGDDAERGPDAAGHERAHQPDDQRHARAVDQTTQDVAALEIGAERRRQAPALHPERRGEDLGSLHRQRRVVRRDQMGEGRHENQPAENDDHGQGPFARRLHEGGEPAGPGPFRGEPGIRRNGRHRRLPRAHRVSLILGSMMAYRMSTSRLITTIMKPAMTTTPWTSGKSRWKMPS